MLLMYAKCVIQIIKGPQSVKITTNIKQFLSSENSDELHTVMQKSERAPIHLIINYLIYSLCASFGATCCLDLE